MLLICYDIPIDVPLGGIILDPQAIGVEVVKAGGQQRRRDSNGGQRRRGEGRIFDQHRFFQNMNDFK